ncbi:MAG: hypothetical protein QM662_01540 [Gordonia sp. (in: high G+C Gram-positive bacteria)]
MTAHAFESRIPLILLTDKHPAASLATPLAVDYARVIIAHTTGTAREAGRLASVIVEARPDAPTPELFDCGPATDFDSTSRRLSEIDVAAPYRLDYTGGTRVQAVCGIWRHLDDHAHLDGAHHLRHYFDNRTRALLSDGPTPHRAQVHADLSRVTLARLARLEGYRLDGGASPVDIRRGATATAVDRDLERLRGLLVGRRAPATPQLRAAVAALGTHIVGLPDSDYLTSAAGGKLRGDAIEIYVACRLAHAMRGRENVEIRHATRAYALDEPPKSPPHAELDVVVRVGLTVWVIETKAAADTAIAEFSRRETFARLTFGPEAGVAMVTAGHRTATRQRRLDRLRNILREPVATRVRAETIDLRAPKQLSRFATRIATPATTTRRTRAPITAPVDVLICALGSRVGVSAVIGETPPGRTGLLTLAGAPSTAPTERTTPSGEAGRHGEMISFPAPDLAAATAHAVARDSRPARLGVVSGPKSALAGFVRYVHEVPDAQLIYLDRLVCDGQSRRIHVGHPGRGWQTRPRKYPERWSEYLATKGFRPASGESTAHRVVGAVIAQAAAHDVTAWLPTSASPRGITHLLLAGAHNTASVTVIGTVARGTITTPDTDAARVAVLDFAATVESATGPANRTVVAMPDDYLGDGTHPGSRRSRWQLLATENDWLPFGTLGLVDEAVTLTLPDALWIDLGG